MNKRFLLLSLLALACAFITYGQETDDEVGPDTRPMVFLGEGTIENKSDNKRANFDGLIDRLSNGLTECGVYRVLNAFDLSAGAADDDIFKVISDDGGKESKVETPAMKVYMTVMQYGFAQNASQDMYGNVQATFQAKIELILKVVDMRTKETLKSKNIARSATGTATTQSNLVEQVLQEANKKVVNDIIEVLISITPFGVMDVEGKEVLIDAPGNRLSQGQELPVFKKGKKVRNKRTGKLTARESQVATICVVTISEDSVTCMLKSGEITPDEEADEGYEYDKYVVRIPENATPSPTVSPAIPQPTPLPVDKNIAPF